MKVLDRINRIKKVLNDSGVDRTAGALKILITDEIGQLKDEIAVALLFARQVGYQAGSRDGLNRGQR